MENEELQLEEILKLQEVIKSLEILLQDVQYTSLRRIEVNSSLDLVIRDLKGIQKAKKV